MKESSRDGMACPEKWVSVQLRWPHDLKKKQKAMAREGRKFSRNSNRVGFFLIERCGIIISIVFQPTSADFDFF